MVTASAGYQRARPRRTAARTDHRPRRKLFRSRRDPRIEKYELPHFEEPVVGREPLSERPVVVGSGPAGLAAAACLQQRGVDALVLERSSSVGTSWRGRYDNLHLNTVRWLSHLPGLRISREYGRWPRRE